MNCADEPGQHGTSAPHRRAAACRPQVRWVTATALMTILDVIQSALHLPRSQCSLRLQLASVSLMRMPELHVPCSQGPFTDRMLDLLETGNECCW